MPAKADKYSWHTVGLDKETTFKLRDYIRKHEVYTDAYESSAIVDLLIEALQSDAIQRNVDFVKLLEDMEFLSAKNKQGLDDWKKEKERLLGYNNE